MVKNHDAGELSSIPGSERFSVEGNGYLFHYFLPEEFHGQGSLVGYSSWGCKELDVTEQLTFSAYFFFPTLSHTYSPTPVWIFIVQSPLGS